MRATRWGVSGRSLWVGAAALFALGLCARPGGAQASDIAAQGREVLTKSGEAVVTVKLAVKMRMSQEGREEEQESTSEITATVVDPSGLAVCALSEADPTNAISQMWGGDDPDFKFEMDITDVKMRLGDGTEVPAKVVLRDKDLDLAFIRPLEAPAKPLTAVDLAAAGTTEVLREVVILERMGEVANRVPAVLLDRIISVIQKPRLMYVPGLIGQYSSLGCPAFTPEGKLIGVLVHRFPPQTGADSREERSPLGVILPAADIADVAKQAPAAAAEAK